MTSFTDQFLLHCFTDLILRCQKCFSRALAQNATGRLVTQMTGSVCMILDHIHIVGLSSIKVTPCLLLGYQVPTVESTPEHKPTNGGILRTHTRQVVTTEHCNILSIAQNSIKYIYFSLETKIKKGVTKVWHVPWYIKQHYKCFES